MNHARRLPPTMHLLTLALLTSIVGMLPQRGFAEQVPFSDKAWTIQAQEHRIETFEGQETLFLLNGIATLEDVEFLNGVLQFDIMVVPERGFSGARWRIQDGGNYEDFYIRPHQSGHPDANQYQGVFNGIAAWQIYFGPEYSVAVEYPFGEWIPIRIEVLNDRAQVTIGAGSGDGRPSLVIDDLKRQPMAGAIGVASGFAAARFANFRYTLTDDLKIAPAAPATGKPEPEGLIREWQVSEAVPESSLKGVTSLGTDRLNALTWQSLPVETNGIANLARIQSHKVQGNTAFVRLVLQADQPTVQALNFGFSDRVRVFVNGTLTFSASDMWQSRDYRFLGTVGLFDTVHCALNRGRNEVVLAISESFGGWAITGALVPQPGVRLVDK